MRRIILASLAASLLVIASAADAKAKKAPPQIDVMTQNQYLGADLVPVVEAGAAVLPCDEVPETSAPSCSSPEVIASKMAFNAALLNALGMVAANLPEQRYVALAREILVRRPHVVGLQEVFEFSCTPFPPGVPGVPPGDGCTYGAITGAFNDHLQGTLDALGGRYVAKATVKNLDITLPIVTPSGGAYVHVVDRDVILVRSDLDGGADVVPFYLSCPTTGPSRASVDGCNYDFVATTSIGGSPLRIERGFVGVDVAVGGSRYRVVNTHLEVREPDGSNPYSRIVQSAQAYELVNVALAFPREPDRKLIVVGDINSDPRDELLPVPEALQLAYGLPPVIVPPYMLFAGAGFTDAWTMRPGAATGKGAPLVGFSCCQDEDLGNHHSVLYERIDMIFSLTRPSMVMNARLLGETISSKTWPPGNGGLWPADHAAVAATLRY